MQLTTAFVLALSIYGIAALPSDADAVVPEEVLVQSPRDERGDFEDTRQMLVAMKSQGKNDKDCRKLADNTEDAVKKNIKVEQDTLNKMSKGKECPSRGQKAVENAEDDLAKAKKKAADTAKKYQKSLDHQVDFGKMRFGDLTEGKCGVFFSSSAYTNSKAAAKAAKDAKLKAAGALEQAKKAHERALADQKEAVNKCYCDLKKLHAKTLNDMNIKAEQANKKAWTRAAHIRCVLDGTPLDKCKVTALPKVKKVSLTSAAEAAECGKGKAVTVSGGRTVRCGAQTKGVPVGSVPNPDGNQWICTDSYCDPFAAFNKACRAVYGADTHECTETELENASQQARAKLKYSGYIIASCGVWNKGYGSTKWGGWRYTCRSMQNNGVWSDSKWRQNYCNGQRVPCCKDP